MANLGKCHQLRDRHYSFWLDRHNALICISEWREAALRLAQAARVACR